MPLTNEMKVLADQIYSRELEKIASETQRQMQGVMADAAARNITNSGIAFGNRMSVLEGSVRKLCEARVQSYMSVLQESGNNLTDADVAFIMSQVSQMAATQTDNVVRVLNDAIQQGGMPIPASWAASNLERTRSSIVATIHRNLRIEKGLQEIRSPQPRQQSESRLAFIIMSFNSDLNPLYDEAILPAVTQSGLKPFRVDKEEFEGTINEVILDKLRTSRIVLADLTDERPNCYFELGYAMALGKPYIVSARIDHNPRRPLRSPNDPRVHFDVDSHKVSFWEPDQFDELKRALEERIRGILAL